MLRPHHESAAARRQARASRPLAPAQLHPKAALGPAPVSDTRRAGSTKHTKAQRIAHPQFNPCTLVSLAEAHTITGGSVLSTSEAPLGPTCIYRLSGSKGEITLAVESAKLSQATRGMDRRHAVTVAGRTALCGRLGSPMLFVPLAGGRLLNVTAPCSIAQQFAGRALGRLEA